MTAARRLSGLLDLAPYALIELLLPGGSLIALCLWLYRRYKKSAAVPTSRTEAPDSVPRLEQRWSPAWHRP
jgi:hypothetical protein